MADIFGPIEPPEAIKKFSPTGDPSGLIILFNNLLRLLIVVGGIYALLNFIIAGYSFMSAGNDPKKIDFAWAKIWQSLVGLLIIAASFVIAALIGKLLFGDAMALLRIKIYGPGATPQP
jgi:hypothetical protein